MIKKLLKQIAVHPSEPGGLPIDPVETNLAEVIPVPEPARAAESAQPSKRWYWLKIILIAAGVLSSITVGALVWMLLLPPAIECKKVNSLSPEMEQLYCVQQAIHSGELPQLLASLNTLAQWTPDDPLYSEAQRVMNEGSQAVLAIARQKMEQSDLKGAINLANRIPKTSPAYNDAQAQVADWRSQWSKYERVVAAIQTAMKQQQWDVALQKIVSLREATYDYWRSQRANELSQQLNDERQARKLFDQARTQASRGAPENLSAAITLASQMNPTTFAWAELQPDLNQWSESLLSLGFQQWQRGYLDQAIALAQRVALYPKFAAEAQNLFWLSQARKLVVESVAPWEVSPAQLWKVLGAVAIADRIPAQSRFYTQAQTSLKLWHTQLQELTHMQVAQAAASFDHPATLQFAIGQARQVAVGSPQRQQAQTLIAYWRGEIQRIEDRPGLDYARKLAEPGSLSALKAAIAQAQQIAPNRALRTEAQTLIFEWQQKIQTSEDQPILDQAEQLATAGRLGEAIQTASAIGPQRSLYGQAQASINGWLAELKAIQATQTKGREARRDPEDPKPARSDSENSEGKPSPNYFGEPFIPNNESHSRSEPPAADESAAPPPAPTPARPKGAPDATIVPTQPLEPTPPNSRVVPTEPVNEPLPPTEPAPPKYSGPQSAAPSVRSNGYSAVPRKL